MRKRSGRQKGAQRHAEGQHGEKARSRFIESLHEGRPPSASELGGARTDGSQRLREDREQHREDREQHREDREQHDEAEKNSEKNRLERQDNQPAEK